MTVTEWLCQPFASGARAVALAAGAVSSYLRGSEAGAVLPATSRQVPLTVAAALSGPPYVCEGEQDSSPEVPSLPAKPTVELAVVPAVRVGSPRWRCSRAGGCLVDLEGLADASSRRRH